MGGGVIRRQWGLAFLNSSKPPGGMKPPLSSLGLRERRPSILPEAGEAVKKAPPQHTHDTHVHTTNVRHEPPLGKRRNLGHAHRSQTHMTLS